MFLLWKIPYASLMKEHSWKFVFFLIWTVTSSSLSNTVMPLSPESGIWNIYMNWWHKVVYRRAESSVNSFYYLKQGTKYLSSLYNILYIQVYAIILSIIYNVIVCSNITVLWLLWHRNVPIRGTNKGILILITSLKTNRKMSNEICLDEF